MIQVVADKYPSSDFHLSDNLVSWISCFSSSEHSLSPQTGELAEPYWGEDVHFAFNANASGTKSNDTSKVVPIERTTGIMVIMKILLNPMWYNLVIKLED